MSDIKRETEPEILSFQIKEEEREDEITKCPMTVSVKSEEYEGPSEKSGVAKSSGDSSFQHLTTKGEGRLQSDGIFAALSDSDDVTLHSSDTDTIEEDVDFDQKSSKSFNKSSSQRNTKECQDVTVEDLRPKEHDPPHVKQEEESQMAYVIQKAEPETLYVKEEQEDEITTFSVTVSVKSKDEGQSEEIRTAKPASSNSFQHPTTKAPT
ncbi:uncharacterized protein LOC130917830 [Corythoichthys intestinalis]|uniref:uncharacterized protein LOC130917830 n=1 Tax=Corythoichthys intestinalis TaxID=161448 RepID=UPI0025A626D9|nr:uncharacterized protein LOC130917830 [Corythoichthys intestinalis]